MATYQKGIERRQAQDKDADGKAELVIYLTKKGEKVREDLDTKAAGRANIILHFEKGKRVREEEDQGDDGKRALHLSSLPGRSCRRQRPPQPCG